MKKRVKRKFLYIMHVVMIGHYVPVLISQQKKMEQLFNELLPDIRLDFSLYRSIDVLFSTELEDRESVTFVFLIDTADSAQEAFYDLQFLQNTFPKAKVICEPKGRSKLSSGKCKIVHRATGQSASCYAYDIETWFQKDEEVCQMYFDPDVWEYKPAVVRDYIDEDEEKWIHNICMETE